MAAALADGDPALALRGEDVALPPVIFTQAAGFAVAEIGKGPGGRFAVFGLWGRDPWVTVDRAKRALCRTSAFCRL